jgi:hypothetical protein
MSARANAVTVLCAFLVELNVIRFGSVLVSVCMNLLFYLIGILLVIVATIFELSTFLGGGGGFGSPA